MYVFHKNIFGQFLSDQGIHGVQSKCPDITHRLGEVIEALTDVAKFVTNSSAVVPHDGQISNIARGTTDPGY